MDWSLHSDCRCGVTFQEALRICLVLVESRIFPFNHSSKLFERALYAVECLSERMTSSSCSLCPSLSILPRRSCSLATAMSSDATHSHVNRGRSHLPTVIVAASFARNLQHGLRLSPTLECPCRHSRRAATAASSADGYRPTSPDARATRFFSRRYRFRDPPSGTARSPEPVPDASPLHHRFTARPRPFFRFDALWRSERSPCDV